MMTMDKSMQLQIQSFIENAVNLMGIEVKEDNIDYLIDNAVMQLNSMTKDGSINLSEGDKNCIRKELEAKLPKK